MPRNLFDVKYFVYNNNFKEISLIQNLNCVTVSTEYVRLKAKQKRKDIPI